MIEYKNFKKMCVELHIGASRIFYDRCLNGFYYYFVSCPAHHSYYDWQRDTSRLYRYDSETERIECIFENTKTYRARVFYRLMLAGKLEKVNPIVIENYLHNGFLSRRGLLAEYSAEKLERMERVSMSHFLLPDRGKAAHEARQFLRNR